MIPIVFYETALSCTLNNDHYIIFLYSIEIETICSCECEKYAEQNSLECSGVNVIFKVNNTHIIDKKKKIIFDTTTIYRFVGWYVFMWSVQSLQ